MDIHIHIEKKHFVILMVAISFLGLFMLGNAADVNINDAWHPLQQIAKSESDTTSVDDNQNDIIDESDKSYGLDATSDVDMNNYLISSLSDPTNAQDAATKNYVDSNDPDPTNEIQNLNNVLSEGNWAGYQRIRGLSDPTNGRDAATKDYVDNNEIRGCTWSGWKPGTIEGVGPCYSCGCADENSQTQLYCDDGEIIDVRNREYCAECDFSCIGTPG
ncbi:MAG: hypothetical protein ACOCQX_00655 [Candidatus Nanoarchaeia archaeon]